MNDRIVEARGVGGGGELGMGPDPAATRALAVVPQSFSIAPRRRLARLSPRITVTRCSTDLMLRVYCSARPFRA